MRELIELRAQHNQLSSLPDTIGQLSRLRELSLRGNTLERLPESVAARLI
jgi:Leucine-rich repeat (LRR) protein